MASIGQDYGQPPLEAGRRELLASAWPLIFEHEQRLIEHLISGLLMIPRVRIYGIADRHNWSQRVATVSLRKEGTQPAALAAALAADHIFSWHGNFYALALTERLGVEQSGGLLRIGLVHYNTVEEIDRCLTILDQA